MVLIDDSQEPRYLSRQQIDDVKWNQCIDGASGSIIYGYSDYLDHLCPGWHALVYGNYDLVMPLTWKQKWGIRYLYQPAFVQQLGIFTANATNEKLLIVMLDAVRQHFRFAEIALNHQNPVEGLAAKQNYILDLSPQYESLKEGYKKDLLNNLRIAARFQLMYGEGDLHVAIRRYETEYSHRLPQIRKEHYRAFERYCNGTGHHAVAIVRQVTSGEGELLCAAILLKTKNRIILNVSVTTARGREQRANHFLLDKLIRELAGSGLLLDFEGSDVPGIASFYKTFGSVDQPYYFFRYNKLPYFLKAFKK